MFRDRDEDVVFIETAKNLRHQPHMSIECVPIPMTMSDTVCIYFKVKFSFSGLDTVYWL